MALNNNNVPTKFIKHAPLRSLVVCSKAVERQPEYLIASSGIPVYLSILKFWPLSSFEVLVDSYMHHASYHISSEFRGSLSLSIETYLTLLNIVFTSSMGQVQVKWPLMTISWNDCGKGKKYQSWNISLSVTTLCSSIRFETFFNLMSSIDSSLKHNIRRLETQNQVKYVVGRASKSGGWDFLLDSESDLTYYIHLLSRVFEIFISFNCTFYSCVYRR